MNPDSRKRHVVSYENMSEELAALFNEKYPRGFNDYLPDLVKYTKPDGTPFNAVTIETPDSIYLVKIKLKTDDAEALERWLEGEEDAENDLNPEADETAENEVSAMPEEKTYYPGDLVDFGTYWQGDKALKREKTPLTWKILDIQDNHALLISVYGLNTIPYNYSFSSIWENCYPREWLNGPFLTSAFRMREMSAILTTTVDNGPDQNSPYFSIGNGPETRDKVFLLSYAEAVKYFPTDDDRICMPTDRAVSNGALVDQARGSCNWWLRTIANSTSACYISTTGSTDKYQYTTAQDIAVRPCIWVDLDADVFKYGLNDPEDISNLSAEWTGKESKPITYDTSSGKG